MLSKRRRAKLPTAGAATPQIWRGELAQVETLLQLQDVEQEEVRQASDSWSSYASNMARRIGTGRNSFTAAGC
jgi:hypothetical protein